MWLEQPHGSSGCPGPASHQSIAFTDKTSEIICYHDSNLLMSCNGPPCCADGTIEDLMQLLKRAPHRCLGWYDKFRTFLNGMGLYKGGKSGASYDQSFFLKLYNGSSIKRHLVDREITLPKTTFNIVGFTQPYNAMAFNAADEEGMGFVQRFVTIYPRPCL